MNFLSKYKFHLALLVIGTTNLIIFYFAYGFHPNNDTGSFISTIDSFKGEDVALEINRYMVPFYPVVAAKLLFFLSSANSIITINIILYLGLLLLTYGLISRVFKNKWIGFVTALLVATSYAMIRYGLTQVQDMGGYFWCVLTMYAIWRWREQKQSSWLYLSSIAVAFGVLTKESGGMGALFAGIIILLAKDGWKKTIKYLAMFSVFPLFTVIVNALRGQEIGFNSLTYFIAVWKAWGPENYTLLRWFGVNASTYNLIWIAVVAGLILLYKNHRVIDREIIVYFIAIIPTSLSYFAWPVFIARTVFISAWLLLPLAAYSLFKLYEKGKCWKYLSVFFVVLLMVLPYILQSTLRYAHVFTIIKDCHNSFICSWNYFWQNRGSISKIL